MRTNSRGYVQTKNYQGPIYNTAANATSQLKTPNCGDSQIHTEHGRVKHVSKNPTLPINCDIGVTVHHKKSYTNQLIKA